MISVNRTERCLVINVLNEPSDACVMDQKGLQSIVLGGLIVTLYGWGFITLNPAYPSIADELHVSPQLVGLLLSFYALPGIFVYHFTGFLSS